MSLQDFLNFLLTAAGTGAATFGLIEFTDKVAGPLPANAKFYASMALSFTLPLIAYLAQVKLEYATFGVDGLFAAVVCGWVVSQGIHKGTEAK